MKEINDTNSLSLILTGALITFVSANIIEYIKIGENAEVKLKTLNYSSS